MPTSVSRAQRVAAHARARAGQRGATFPEILLMVGLFSLLATFVVPPVIQYFQQSEVSRTMRSDCQVVILDAMRTGQGGAPGSASKDCVPVTAAPASAPASASAASASAAR